jgi:hypothetical protein
MFKTSPVQKYSFVFFMSHHTHASVFAWLLKTKAEKKYPDGINSFLFLKASVE